MTPERFEEIDRVLSTGGKAIVISQGCILVTFAEIEEYQGTRSARPDQIVDQSWRDWFCGWMA